jgi:hypothetical protein
VKIFCRDVLFAFQCLEFAFKSSADMTGGSPLGSPVTGRRAEPNGLMEPALREQIFSQQMMRNSPSYAIQQQMLQVNINFAFSINCSQHAEYFKINLAEEHFC